MRKGSQPSPSDRLDEKAYLVGVGLPDSPAAREWEYMEELEQLALTAGAQVVGKTVQARTRIDGATYIGPGKVEEVAGECGRLGANLVIFDNDLSPAQARNLEKVLDINVIDRTELILDIFANHAKTRQARIQVELAQLSYALPRLRKLWDHLSRQAGGIGTRGPGETQLEVDRRRIQVRMSRLKRQLKRLEMRKDVVRRSREGLPIAAIVGYTNTGKSTLMNALTGAGTAVKDQLFATLDTTTRRILGSGDGDGPRPILLIDTVGFIRKLPHHLVTSFKATLEDIAQAGLYIHVIDSSHRALLEQMEVTDTTLAAIENPGVGTIHVFNKIDRVGKTSVKGLSRRFPDAVFVSAKRGDGIDELKERIERHFLGVRVRVELKLPLSDGRTIAKARRLFIEPRDRVEGESLVLSGSISSRNVPALRSLESATPGASVRMDR